MRQRGFTIVELLIVIVVISILAAIVIVTFSGVQQRARATQTESMAIAAKKHMLAYRAEHGSYPPSLGGRPSVSGHTHLANWACYGSSFPAGDGMATGVCGDFGSLVVSTSSSLNTALSSIYAFPQNPITPLTSLNGGSAISRGVDIYYPTDSSDSYSIFYEVAVEGTCTEGTTNTVYSEGQRCRINLPR